MKNRKDKESRTLPLDKLHDHPKQSEMFGNLPDAELESLAADMAKEGQRDPVEVLPDGTIITGHQRVRAARRLGWKEIEVVVRHDLAGAGEAAVEELFVADNLFRRQLGPLARARCMRRLMELKTGDKAWGLNGAQRENLKTEIGRQLGLSLRSVNRYLLILGTPPAVQAAFDRVELSLTVAGRVALLDKKDQSQVARRIEAGETASKVVAEALHPRGDDGDDVGRSFGRLVSSLERELPLLAGKTRSIRAGRLKSSAPVITKACVVLKELAKLSREKDLK